MEAINLLRIDPAQFLSFLYSTSAIFFFLTKSSNQYSVSEHSFNAISSLWTKSALLCAYFASWRFAPIEDDERSNWLTYTEHPLISSHTSEIDIANSIASSRNLFFSSTISFHPSIYLLRRFDIWIAAQFIRYLTSNGQSICCSASNEKRVFRP